MKISRPLAEIETDIDDSTPVTILFPATKAQISITFEEAHQLWKCLGTLFKYDADKR